MTLENLEEHIVQMTEADKFIIIPSKCVVKKNVTKQSIMDVIQSKVAKVYNRMLIIVGNIQGSVLCSYDEGPRCQGDSGGPLVAKIDNYYTLVMSTK